MLRAFFFSVGALEFRCVHSVFRGHGSNFCRIIDRQIDDVQGKPGLVMKVMGNEGTKA